MEGLKSKNKNIKGDGSSYTRYQVRNFWNRKKIYIRKIYLLSDARNYEIVYYDPRPESLISWRM